MSHTESSTDTSKLNLWNPLVNLATFSGAGYYLGPDVIAKLGDSIVKWIPTPLSSYEFAVGGAFNALAVSGMEHFTGTDGSDIDLNKMVVVTLTLAAAIFVVPHVSKATAQWTGVVLTTEKMMAIAAFNGAVKAVTFGLIHFTHYLKNASIPVIPTNEDEARNISYFQVSALHDLLKKDTLEWDKLSLSIRVILNKRFAENGTDLQLPLHGFKSNVGSGLNEEEIKFLHEQVKTLTAFTEEEYLHLNTIFYQAGLPPQGAVVSKAVLPPSIETDLAAYKLTDYAALPKATVIWICAYFYHCGDKVPPTEEAGKALCDRMVELKLASPRLELAPSKVPTKPTDLSNLKEDEKHLISWFYGYFGKNLSEWEGLSLADRLEWSQVFQRELNIFFAVTPSLVEAKALTPEQTLSFHQQYNNHNEEGAGEWAKLPVEVQVALNTKFVELGPAPRVVYPQTLADAAKMSKEDLRSFHQHLSVEEMRVNYLKPEAKKELTARFSKLSLTMPGVITPPDTSYWRHVTLKNAAITVGIVGVTYVAVWFGPTVIAAFGNMFKGSGPQPKGDDRFCVDDQCSREYVLQKGSAVNVTLASGHKEEVKPGRALNDGFTFQEGHHLSFRDDSTMCVGTVDTPCQTKIRLNGVSAPFTVFTTPPQGEPLDPNAGIQDGKGTKVDPQNLNPLAQNKSLALMELQGSDGDQQ